MTYKMEITGIEGLLMALALMVAPSLILFVFVLVRLLPTKRLFEGLATGSS